MAFSPTNGGALEIITDGENPRIFTAIARTAISGGQFVVVSGAANVIGSTALQYSPGSVVVDLLNNSNYANGIALLNAGSNTLIPVATRGTWIATAAGIVSGGAPVIVVSGTVQGVAMYGGAGSTVVLSGLTVPGYVGTKVGRAQTAAASGTNNFLLVDFSF